MSGVRAAVVGVLALLLSGLVVRDAMVRGSLLGNGELAAAVWPGHPEAAIRAGLIAIDRADKAGRKIDTTLTAPVIAAARGSPLSPDPFLVRGAALRDAGDEQRAGVAFAAARDRAPRSVTAQYFLADHYRRIGNPAMELVELGRLMILVPEGRTQLARAIVAHLRRPDVIASIETLMAKKPQFKDDLLFALAYHPTNLSLVNRLDPDGRGAWVPLMVERLVDAGDYEKALAVWSRGGLGDPAPALLRDPGFALAARPPFGWTLASGAAGVTETTETGGLHIVHFGRERMVAASQLLVLPPGEFALTYTAIPATGDLSRVQWTVTCQPTQAVLAQASLGVSRPGDPALVAWTVPPGCRGQRLELVAEPGDTAATIDFTVANLSSRRLP